MSPVDRPRGAVSTQKEGEAPEIPDAEDVSVTRPYAHAPGAPEVTAVRRFLLTVVEGPGVGTVWDSVSDACSIGSHPSNDFNLDDPTVSRFHCEIRVGPKGARVKDLDSTDGVLVDGVQETFQVAASLLKPPPAMDSTATDRFVDAILPMEGRMLSRLVVGSLLPAEQKSLAA